MIWDTGGPDARHMVLKSDLRRGDADRRGDEFLRATLADLFRQLRTVEFREAAGPRKPYPTADRPDDFLQHDDGVLLGGTGKTLERQADRGPDSRMPGERKLLRRREDPDFCRMRGILRRQHEDRLAIRTRTSATKKSYVLLMRSRAGSEGSNMLSCTRRPRRSGYRRA